MIDVKNLHKSFGNHEVLKGVNEHIEKGEKVVVIGPSGSGKSTFLRCLNLLETPDDGTLSVGDSGVITLRGGKAYDAQGRKLTERKLGAMRRGIGMIFQHFNLLDRSTVFENIAYPLRYTGMKKADIAIRVKELLEQCGLEEELAKRYPHEVSGGQCQRAAIARALAVEPKVLICDEATSSLDVTIQKQIMELLEELKDTHGLSFIFICHNLALVQSFCDKVLVLYDGKVVESGKPDDIINEPKEAYTKKLVDAVFE